MNVELYWRNLLTGLKFESNQSDLEDNSGEVLLYFVLVF